MDHVFLDLQMNSIPKILHIKQNSNLNVIKCSFKLYTKKMTRKLAILTILSKNFCPVTALSLQYTPPGPGRPHCKPSYWSYRNEEYFRESEPYHHSLKLYFDREA